MATISNGEGGLSVRNKLNEIINKVEGSAQIDNNITFSDGSKAIFGAGSDLQIYHDGSNSYISDQGVGSLWVQATNLIVEATDGSNYLTAVDGGAVKLYYADGASNEKLATTSTGIDVTGTVTADGLTVDNSGTAITITNGDGLTQLGKFSGDATNGFVIEGKANNNLTLKTKANTLGEGIKFVDTSDNNLMFIDGTTGDISFYEATGTTPKFFWDASAESLGIGTSSPAKSIETRGGVRIAESTGAVLDITPSSTGTNGVEIKSTYYADGYGPLIFNTGNAERMRIDSSGRVMIGNTVAGSMYSSFDDLVVGSGSGDAGMTIYSGSVAGTLAFADSTSGDGRYRGWMQYTHNNDTMTLATSATERMRIDSSGNVGIGTNDPAALGGGAKLTVNQAADGNIVFARGGSTRQVQLGTTSTTGYINADNTSGGLAFHMNGTERMRIDSSGNLLVGKTTTGATTAGMAWISNEYLQLANTETGAGDRALLINRQSADGTLIEFRKANATVGSIGSSTKSSTSRLMIGTGDTGLYFFDSIDAIYPVNTTTGSDRDNAVSLGDSSSRFKDLYLSGGVYLGGTGAANKLDDYEEGDFAITFTPDTSGSISMNSSYNRAAYTKIGNLVTVTGLGIVSTVSSPVGYVKIPLPFTVANGTDRMNDSAGSCAVHNSNANMRDFIIMTTEGSTDAIIRLGDATTFQDDSGQAFKAGTQVYFSITYRTA